MSRIFLTLILVLSLFSLSAQDSDSVVVEPPFPVYEGASADSLGTDSISASESSPSPAWKGDNVDVKKFDERHWKKLVGSRNYEEQPEKVKEKEEEEKETDEGNEKSEIKPWDSSYLKIVAYALIALLIGVVLYNLAKNLAGPGAIKLNRTELNSTSGEIENIEDFDVRSPLAKALAEGNFKLAIRLYYLNLLKTLNEGGTIRWKKDKTNREYLSELFVANYHYDEIRALTLSYEEVWYGEHRLSNELLQEIIRNFETINQQITPQPK